MTRETATGEWPEDAVEVGRIVGAWGVKGWIRIAPIAASPEALLQARLWYLQRDARPAQAPVRRHISIRSARRHGDGVVAGAYGVADRGAAEALAGCAVFVSRGDFPATAADEYYWVDLIGLSVVNRAGVALGRVVGLLDTGVHSVLRVAEAPASTGGPGPAPAERLIPFVSAYVDRVDLGARIILVDWGLDY